jgi:hypothetical protein
MKRARCDLVLENVTGQEFYGANGSETLRHLREVAS